MEQVGQMLLGTFASAQREGIKASHPTFEFMQSLADGLAVPAESAFSETVAARSKFLDGASEKASAVGSFERFGSLNQPSFARVSEVHEESSGYGRPSILPHSGRFAFSDSLKVFWI